MLDEKELKKTKRVNITGEIPNGRLQILDNNGKIKEFRLREMTIAEQEQKLTSVIEKIIVFIIREL